MKIKFNNITIDVQNIDIRKEGCHPTKEECILCFKAWGKQILYLVEKRKDACKRQLLNNLDRVVYSDDYIIEYVTASVRHYSRPAMDAMERVSNINTNPNEIWNDKAACLQIIKALYWADDNIRNTVIAGTSFDDLYSMLLERLTCEY
jgi:hypothetical protein